MITLDYKLHDEPSEKEDLRNLTETDLHYRRFLGDIVFRIDGLDMSASWEWIPIIDFAACLHRIAEHLQPHQTESFEFTESEDRIDFTSQGNAVEIQATYVSGTAHISLDELRRSAQEFLRRVLDELAARNRSLAANPIVRGLYPKSLVAGGSR